VTPRTSATSRDLSFRACLSVGVVGLVVILAGCSLGGSEGQSKESADAALSSVPGVSEGSVNTRSTMNGLHEETYTTVQVHVEPGFSVPDPEALVEYLVGVAWSTKTKEASSTVQIIVLSDPQVSIGDAVEGGPWEHTGVDPNSPERAAVRAAEVKERFGDWPGEVPVLPDGLALDRSLQISSAEMGFGVHDLEEYPATADVPHYSLMAPGDLLAYPQGLEVGDWGHGGSPLTTDGFVRLETGYLEAGDVSSGQIRGHSAVWDKEGTTILQMYNVIAGEQVELYAEPELISTDPDTGQSVYTNPVMEPGYKPKMVDVQGGDK